VLGPLHDRGNLSAKKTRSSGRSKTDQRLWRPVEHAENLSKWLIMNAKSELDAHSAEQLDLSDAD
jgi:hypothetical protein